VPLIDYFIARDDAEAARVEPGMGGPEACGFAALPAKGIDPAVAAGTLESILTGRPYDEVTADPRQCQLLTDDEEAVAEGSSLVVTVTDTLRDALATADTARLAEVAAAWSRTEELSGLVEPEVLADFLKLFADLARAAVDRGGRLYCWWAL
jgi:hypothetical protein